MLTDNNAIKLSYNIEKIFKKLKVIYLICKNVWILKHYNYLKIFLKFLKISYSSEIIKKLLNLNNLY